MTPPAALEDTHHPALVDTSTVAGSGRTPHARRRSQRRRALALGLLFLVPGLALMCFVLWQVWGTNLVAGHVRGQLLRSTDKAWASERPANTDRGLVGAVVRIPRFGSDYRVPVLEGTTDDILASGYGHYTDSAEPGERGNFVIAAHRVTHGEPLRRMPELRAGDRIKIETADGLFTYRLTTGGTDLVVPFTASWVLDPHPKNPHAGGIQPPQGAEHRLITLVTCAELFHTDDRMVAFGVLESVDATVSKRLGKAAKHAR